MFPVKVYAFEFPGLIEFCVLILAIAEPLDFLNSTFDTEKLELPVFVIVVL